MFKTYRSTTKIHQGEPNLYLEPAKPRQPNPIQSGWFNYKSEKLLQMVLWTETLEIQHNQDIQIEKN